MSKINREDFLSSYRGLVAGSRERLEGFTHSLFTSLILGRFVLVWSQMPDSNRFSDRTPLPPSSFRVSEAQWLSPNFRRILYAVAIAWLLEIVDVIILGGWLDSFGVRPRKLSGLVGIPLMPLLHGGLAHLASNTFPFIILGWIVSKAEGKHFVSTTGVLIFLSGLGTWLIGSGGVHIGASGLVYGYFGYVMCRAWLERKPLWLLTGIFVGIFYGGMIFGIIPHSGPPVSWEGHLSGLVAGVWLGYRRSRQSPLIETQI